MSTTRLRIGPADQGRPLSQEEFREANETLGFRYELERGRLEMSADARARRRDLEEKKDEYLGVGLREYWIVDPKPRRVVVLAHEYGPAGPSWAERIFRGDEPIEGRVLPGLAPRVELLWADPPIEGPAVEEGES